MGGEGGGGGGGGTGQGVEWTVDCRRLFLKALFLCASCLSRADVAER